MPVVEGLREQDMSIKNAKRMSPDEKRLIRRYLLWCYKTTREDWERVERKFTQLTVDRHVLAFLRKQAKGVNPAATGTYESRVELFKKYIEEKEKGAVDQKYVESGSEKKVLQPNYLYLKNRLEAVEKTIARLLGKKERAVFQGLYDTEMTRRILEAREHT